MRIRPTNPVPRVCRAIGRRRVCRVGRLAAMQQSGFVTADYPRRFSRGQHFDIARATAEALQQKIASEHRQSLLLRFGFQKTSFPTWLDDLLQGAESDLIELAQQLE